MQQVKSLQSGFFLSTIFHHLSRGSIFYFFPPTSTKPFLHPISLLAALSQGRPFDPVTQTATPAGSFNTEFVCGTYIYIFHSFHSVPDSLRISTAAAVNLRVLAEEGVFANPLFISTPCTPAAPTMAHVQRDVLI